MICGIRRTISSRCLAEDSSYGSDDGAHRDEAKSSVVEPVTREVNHQDDVVRSYPQEHAVRFWTLGRLWGMNLENWEVLRARWY